MAKIFVEKYFNEPVFFWLPSFSSLLLVFPYQFQWKNEGLQGILRQNHDKNPIFIHFYQGFILKSDQFPDRNE